MTTRSLSVGLLIVVLLTACTATAPQAQLAPSSAKSGDLANAAQSSVVPTRLPATATLAPSATSVPPTQAPTAVPPTATATQAPVLNPLTGLPVDDPTLLNLPPALVSISNFPVSARPQAGMSTSPLVFEMYIGEGMTRFLALFYGKYAANASAPDPTADIGPIRSGRIAYEDVRRLYNGFIVMSGAWSGVASQLSHANTVYNQNESDINGDKIGLDSLKEMAAGMKDKKLGQSNLSSVPFTSETPDGGETAQTIDLWWNALNRVQWTYDAASGTYLRFQDKADESGKFYPATDKLNGQQLAFSNVVVLFAKHDFKAPTLVNIDLLDQTKMPAYLFRDGKAYKASWSTLQPITPLQFKDANGQVIPYKPGNTFFEIVSTWTGTTHPGDGSWKFYFPIPE